MLDIKFIRENLGIVKDSIKNRNLKLSLDEVIEIDDSRKKILSELEDLRHKQNTANEEISRLLKEKKDAKPRIESMKKISQEINSLEQELKDRQAKLNELLLNIPNIPHNSVPVGNSTKSQIVRQYGKLRRFDFNPLSHIEISSSLDIIDFPSASKISGSNFAVYKGYGARLERALINFMLDLHTKENGYLEIFPPFLVNRSSMIGTYKVAEDLVIIGSRHFHVIPPKFNAFLITRYDIAGSCSCTSNRVVIGLIE